MTATRFATSFIPQLLSLLSSDSVKSKGVGSSLAPWLSRVICLRFLADPTVSAETKSLTAMQNPLPITRVDKGEVWRKDVKNELAMNSRQSS